MDYKVKLEYIASIAENNIDYLNSDNYKLHTMNKTQTNNQNDLKQDNKKGMSSIYEINKLNLSINAVDSLTAKLIRKYIEKQKNKWSKGTKEDYNKLTHLQITEKKLLTFKYFLNLSLITLSLKYIDIFYKVKHGGK